MMVGVVGAVRDYVERGRECESAGRVGVGVGTRSGQRFPLVLL